MTLRNIRLLIAYDGSAYSGWQRQNNAPTIQGTLEKSIAVMTGAKTTLHGAGRTDAGVHATGMTANFETRASIACEGFINGLNSMLPKDIRILEVDEVDIDFHSRYSATAKTYAYTFFTGEIQLPTDRLYTAHYFCNLDVQQLIRALESIRGTHDFSSFEAAGSRDTSSENGRGAVRTLFQAELSPYTDKADTWIFTFTGDGFLRHMVRNIVGTLLEVGSGKITPGDFRSIFSSCDRKCAGATAPACGLVLKKVHYKPFSSQQ